MSLHVSARVCGLTVSLLLSLLPSAVQAEGPVAEIAPGTNVTAAFRSAIASVRAGGTIRLRAGDYHFYAAQAENFAVDISNHDHLRAHSAFLPLVGVRDVTIEGNGARLIGHDPAIMALVMDSSRVTIRDVSVDFERAPFTELRFVEHRDGKGVFACDRMSYPVEVDAGCLYAVRPTGRTRCWSGSLFDAATGCLKPGVTDIGFVDGVEELPDGNLLLSNDYAKLPCGPLRPGDVYLVRGWERPNPAFFLCRARQTVFEDVRIHAAFGMGLLAQLSEDVTFRGTRSASARTCGVFPAPGRMAAHVVDATHFSNVKGRVCVENAWFERMLDDAVNVHSTAVELSSTLGCGWLYCKFRHEQSYGFDLFRPGDEVRFIKGKTLENGPVRKVAEVRRLSAVAFEMRVEGGLPDGYGAGDALENATWQCAVTFRGNHVAKNRARGALFTTPYPVRVENNVFEDVTGAAVLLAGDAQGWYESGACEDVLIRGNRFRNCMTSRFQFCEAVVSIYPMVRDLAAQRRRYHRNVRIEDNVFDMFDAPLLFAVSADGLVWRRNRLNPNVDRPSWNLPRFRVSDCEGVSIDDPAYSLKRLSSPQR